MNKNSSRRFWFTLVIFSLVGQIAWVVETMYFNVFIYKMFNASASDISAMVALSAVMATITTLVIGALSDKLGKRKIFICGGYVLWGLSILGFALVRVDLISSLVPTALSVSSICVTIVIVMDCVMTFFGSSANDACFNAWLTDVTENGNRGAAEGINSMMPLMGILAVFGGFMSFNLDLPSSWTTIFIIIGAIVMLIGASGFFLIQESAKEKSKENYFANIFYGFKPSVILKNPTLYVVLGGFALFGISIQIFMPYLIIYYEVSLKLENYTLIMAPAIIIAGIITAFYGRYYDKKGFLPSFFPAIGSLILGYVVLYFSRDVLLVFFGSLLMMTGDLTGMAVFGAMIRDYTPKGTAGRLQGLRIVGQVLIPNVIGPIIGASILANAETMVNQDGTTSFIPNSNIFLGALVVALVLSFVVILTKKFYSPAKKEQKENGAL